MRKVLQLDPRDNVLIALTDLKEGEIVEWNGSKYPLVTRVSAKHKIATEDLSLGAPVTMYGVLVGKTTQPVRRGEALTLTNVRHEALPYRDQEGEFNWKAPDVSRWAETRFQGYRRADGQVGTRNHWIVVPLVFCENRNILNLQQAFEEELGFAPHEDYRLQVAELAQLYRQGKTAELRTHAFPHNGQGAVRKKLFENLDGIRFLLHEGGCGGTREDANNLCGLIADYIHHPNVAGATVLSLGCQHAQVSILREQVKIRDPKLTKPLVILEQQKSGTESTLISDAIRGTFEGLVEANQCTRAPAPLGKLTVALKCGGSDGFSGISANPAIGHTADIMAGIGGKTVLSEFPELCGVEQELVNRCIREEDGQRFLRLMRDYNARAQAIGSGFDMNPSPGNIRDGLITDAMKSAGAAKKGGASPVTAVLDFPEYITESGLNLLCTPGNDVECVTAQVGSGASVVLFTTGLGTPTGNPIAPVVKISTNSDLARRMPDIIDLDAGTIITGQKSVQAIGEDVFELVIQVANGEVQTKAELLAQDDFIPWKRGVSL